MSPIQNLVIRWVVCTLVLWLSHIYLYSNSLKWFYLSFVGKCFCPCVVSRLVWGCPCEGPSETWFLPELQSHKLHGAFSVLSTEMLLVVDGLQPKQISALTPLLGLQSDCCVWFSSLPEAEVTLGLLPRYHTCRVTLNDSHWRYIWKGGCAEECEGEAHF